MPAAQSPDPAPPARAAPARPGRNAAAARRRRDARRVCSCPAPADRQERVGALLRFLAFELLEQLWQRIGLCARRACDEEETRDDENWFHDTSVIECSHASPGKCAIRLLDGQKKKRPVPRLAP